MEEKQNIAAIINAMMFIDSYGLSSEEVVPGNIYKVKASESPLITERKACEILTNDPANNSKYISNLRKRLYDGIVWRLSTYGLQDIVHINGNLNLDNLGKTMNLRFDGIDGQTLMLLLDSNGVCVSTGSACNSHETKPSRVLKSIGLTDEEAMSSIRISVSRMNTVDEIDTAAGIIADSVYSLHSVANG